MFYVLSLQINTKFSRKEAKMHANQKLRFFEKHLLSENIHHKPSRVNFLGNDFY